MSNKKAPPGQSGWGSLARAEPPWHRFWLLENTLCKYKKPAGLSVRAALPFSVGTSSCLPCCRPLIEHEPCQNRFLPRELRDLRELRCFQQDFRPVASALACTLLQQATCRRWTKMRQENGGCSCLLRHFRQNRCTGGRSYSTQMCDESTGYPLSLICHYSLIVKILHTSHSSSRYNQKTCKLMFLHVFI